MKRIFTLASLLLAVSASGYAQGEMDAFNLSYNDLTGTARSVSMGGAFGALGGDVSAISINPAGIGVYSVNEVVTTLNFTNTTTKTNFGGSKMDDKKFRLNFDNLAFVGVFPMNSDDVPRLNFGFSYNRLKSFDRKVSMGGSNRALSLTHYIANRANDQNDFDYITTGTGYGDHDWLSILGYSGGLIDKNPDGSKNFVSTARGQNVDSRMVMREKGDVSSYDFNVGTTIADMFSLGATLAVTDVNYNLYSEHSETFLGSQSDRYSLINNLRTEGAGWQVKAGLIFKPVNELRVGVSYHSPTWYNLTDYFYGEVVNSWDPSKVYHTPDDAYTEYKFRTPDKWVFSLAGVIGKTAIISADYELTGYNRMNLQDMYGYEFEDTDYIKEDFKSSSVFRVGAEIKFTPQFAARVGYMWQQSPVKDVLRNGSVDGSHTVAMPNTKTIPQYTVVGDANHFTWGLGYRFTPHFYTDVAFVVKNRTDDFYSFAGNEKAELTTNQVTGLLTLGYKF
ncbi:MAG: hypothetical protein RL662_2273 [Bacteroidota bacterium]|jgi:long-subunit fatty acid transport protein